MEVKELFKSSKIIPVIKLEEVGLAEQLAKALLAGGMQTVEITFRAAGADEVIRRMKKACPDLLVGAGTVLTEEQLDRAVDAGASFAVAPGLNPNIITAAQKAGIAFMPGVMTPSEIEQAMGFGLKYLKFFPAEQAGGPAYLKAVGAPYPEIRFMPTGGISLGNLKTYLSLKNVAACGGSFMVTETLLKERQFDEITRLSRQAVEIAKQ